MSVCFITFWLSLPSICLSVCLSVLQTSTTARVARVKTGARASTKSTRTSASAQTGGRVRAARRVSPTDPGEPPCASPGGLQLLFLCGTAAHFPGWALLRGKITLLCGFSLSQTSTTAARTPVKTAARARTWSTTSTATVRTAGRARPVTPVSPFPPLPLPECTAENRKVLLIQTLDY